MKFYCEAVPQKKAGGKAFNYVYHKNSQINIRGVINRHLQNINRNIYAVRDKDLKWLTEHLMVCWRKEWGPELPSPQITRKLQSIEPADLQQIFTYLKKEFLFSCHSETYCLVSHINSFLLMGARIAPPSQLKSLLNLKNYEHGEYVTQQKNFQGEIRSVETPSDKRMYAEDTECCPVKMLKTIIRKDPLWCHITLPPWLSCPGQFRERERERERFGSHLSLYLNALFIILLPKL